MIFVYHVIMKENNKCILISLKKDISELKDLAESLDYDVNEVFIQYRETPHSGLFIGKGKVKEIVGSSYWIEKLGETF